MISLFFRTHVVSPLLLPSVPRRPRNHPGHRYHILSCDQPAGEGPRPGGLPFVVCFSRPSHFFIYFAHSCTVGAAPSGSLRRFLVAAERNTPRLLPAFPRGMHAAMLATIHTLLGPSQRQQWPHAVHHRRRLKPLIGLLALQRAPPPAPSLPRRQLVANSSPHP